MIIGKNRAPRGRNRRHFLGLAAGGLTASAVARAEAVGSPGVTNQRLNQAFRLRVDEATQDAHQGAATNLNNGDDAFYPDKGGTYTKGFPHDSFGRVDLSAYQTFKNALASGGLSHVEDMPQARDRPQDGTQS